MYFLLHFFNQCCTFNLMRTLMVHHIFDSKMIPLPVVLFSSRKGMNNVTLPNTQNCSDITNKGS